MTPPEAKRADPTGKAVETPPAASVCPVATLQKRRDFLAAARARRQVTQGFILQARRRSADEGPAELIRIGYTASKKVGNAVTRARAKRRLRAIVHEVLATAGKPGWDYVLVARNLETVGRPFHLLVEDLEKALHRIHAPRKPKS